MKSKTDSTAIGAPVAAHRRMRALKPLLAVAAIGAIAPADYAHSASICDAISGNLVQNCGFEAGTRTVGDNTSVPNDWTTNPAFLTSDFNQVATSYVNSGTHALAIGDYDYESPPSISQVITDTLGQSYTGTFYLNYTGSGDPNAYFDADINGTVVSDTRSNVQLSYTQEQFSFIGSGSDTLSFTGNTNPSEWHLDDIVVTSVAPVPAPPAVWLLLSGLCTLAAVHRRHPARPALHLRPNRPAR